MYRGSFLYFRTCLRIACVSICFGLSSILARIYLKYLALGHLLILRCVINRPRIFELSLLPIYTGILSLSAKLYMPIKPLSNDKTSSRLNSYHLRSTGITYLLIVVNIIIAALKLLSNRLYFAPISSTPTLISGHIMFGCTWRTSRASFYPSVMASSGGLSR